MKKEFCGAALVCCALAMSGAYAGESRSLESPGQLPVVNGGFEQGMENWEGAGTAVSAASHGGERSLLLEKGYMNQPPSQGKLVQILPGGDYRISVWIKCDGCDAEGVSVMGVCLDAGGKWVSHWLEGASPQFIHDGGASPALLATGGTHGWTKFTADMPAAQIPESARSLLIYLRHDANKEPKGSAFFDDLSVERLPPGTVKIAPKENEVRNGSFEDGAKGWSGPFVSKSAAIVKDDGADGDGCLKLSGGYVLQEGIHVEGGRRYRIGMRIKCESAPEESVFVQASYRGPGVAGGWYGPVRVSYETHTEPAVFVTGGSFGWREFSAVIAAPAGADRLLIYLRKMDGSEGVAFYDAVKIAVTDAPVTPPGDLRSSGMAPVRPTEDDSDFAKESLENASFEKGLASWKCEGMLAADEQGRPCVRMVNGRVLQGLKVEAKKNYRIEVDIKTEAMAEGSAQLKVQFRGPRPLPAKARWFKPIASGGSHGWETFSSVVQAPPGATDMLIYLVKEVDDGTAWFASLKVAATDAPAMSDEDLEKAETARLLPAPSSTAQDNEALLSRILESARQPGPSQCQIVKNGAASCRIYVGSSNEAVEFHAAKELAKYLKLISGASFEPFAHDSNPAAAADAPLIVVGRANALTSKLCPGVEWDKLGGDGFIIKMSGPHIVIAGAQPRGTLYGVCWFLDRRLGVRWYSPSYTYVPNALDVAAGGLDETHIPRFSYREIFAGDGDDEAYRAHNLLNGKSHHRLSIHSAIGDACWSKEWPDDGHNFRRVVSFKDYGAAHPEYFAGGQLAMMDGNVRKIATDYFLKRLKAPGAEAVYGFSQCDSGWGKPDPASEEFARKHGNALSAPLADMLTDVGGRVRQSFPEAQFASLAYQWSFAPPSDMELPPWLTMIVAPIHSDFSQPFNGAKNKSVAQGIEGWARISSQIYIWDYITNFGAYVLPYPNLDSMFESIQWLSAFPSIHGYFGQGSMASKGAEFALLRQWVGARLLWDPNQDWKALRDEFLKGYYGDAAPFIAEYIGILHESKERSGATMRLRTPVTASYFTFDLMRRADELMAGAEKAVAKQPGFLRRVRTSRIGVDSAIMLRRGDFLAEARSRGIAWEPDAAARLQRIKDYSEAAGIGVYGEGSGSMKSMIQAMALERRPAQPLDVVNGKPSKDWVEFGDLDLMAMVGARVVADPAASDGGAVMMPGKTAAWGIQLKLDCLPPDGKWKLYASVRVDPGEGMENAKALSMGVYPPFGNQVDIKLKDVSDGGYHTFEIPGTYSNDAGMSLWFAPPNSDAIKAMYVDRAVAVRAD